MKRRSFLQLTSMVVTARAASFGSGNQLIYAQCSPTELTDEIAGDEVIGATTITPPDYRGFPDKWYRESPRRWTFPGELIDHLQGKKHGFTEQQLAGLEFEQLRHLHNNHHIEGLPDIGWQKTLGLAKEDFIDEDQMITVQVNKVIIPEETDELDAVDVDKQDDESNNTIASTNTTTTRRTSSSYNRQRYTPRKSSGRLFRRR